MAESSDVNFENLCFVDFGSSANVVDKNIDHFGTLLDFVETFVDAVDYYRRVLIRILLISS
jgi:hypothetical protein